MDTITTTKQNEQTIQDVALKRDRNLIKTSKRLLKSGRQSAAKHVKAQYKTTKLADYKQQIDNFANKRTDNIDINPDIQDSHLSQQGLLESSRYKNPFLTSGSKHEYNDHYTGESLRKIKSQTSVGVG